MKNKKSITLRQRFFISYSIPLITLSALLIGMITLAVLYVLLQEKVLLYVAIGYTGGFIIAYLASLFITYRSTRSVFVDNLYGTTSVLLRNLRNNITSDTKYTGTNIQEINELNEALDEINTVFSNGTLISSDLESAYIPLVFISEEERLVTLDSFKKELRSLIYCSQNYRNALVEVFYDFDDDTLTKEESIRLVSVLTNAFSDYLHVLFVPNDNGTGFYMFLPRIDSFSHIQESLASSMKEISVAKKTFDGLTTINARFSIVCYPYSNINELFPDLAYAKRQGKSMNLYLPNRLSALSDSKIMQNSINLNNMSRALENLSSLEVVQRKREESRKTVKNALSDLIKFLNIDYGGLILFDDVNNSYYSMSQVSSDKEGLFQEGEIVDKDFIKAMQAVVDEDNSLYFSSRRHASKTIATYLDKINVSGGFFYLVFDRDQVVGVIYFFNKDRDLIVDSYIRETMYIFSYRIGDFIHIVHEEDKINETYKEINNILMSSDYALYRIDRSNFELAGFSSHFNTLFPNAKFGEKCYKALYGLDSMCPNCPLKTTKKMRGELNGHQIETSLTLNDTKSRLIRLLVHTLHQDEEIGDRFDKDLLINSYYSLKIGMDNLYAINARGYLLTLRICNIDNILKEAGSEGYLLLLRQFIRRIKELRVSNSNIYSFSNEGIAVLLPEVGQVDIVNFIERIYNVSKEKYQYDGVYYSFDVTYSPYQFPQQYPTASDFLKFVLRHYNSFKYTDYVDMIFFPDSEYTRSASRNEFMLSVIEEQFGNKTFSVALQPFVKANDKAIFGAELLIRLSDKYRNSIFNADELIKVAGQNGKISLISNALIGYIGELYRQYGQTVFKISGFQRLTINTDFSFFSDPEFLQTLFDMFTNYSFAKNFVGFEITEKEVYTYADRFKSITRGILNHHIVLICDQYSGEYMSIEKLKELGFTEIKIGRNIVGDIEVNPKHLDEITSIDKIAKENDIKVTFVGVENADQYILLRDLDKNCMCQGYHFYKPLDDVKLIDELRKNR